MPNHTVTKYEVLSLMPAPSGMEAAFQEEGGGFHYEPVIALAVAKVTEQQFDENGRSESALITKANEIVGVFLPLDGSDPMFAGDMIAEDLGNFRGYRRA